MPAAGTQQRDRAEPRPDRVEHRGAELLVRRVALERNRERAPGLGVELVGDVLHRLAHVDQRHGP